MTHSPAEGFGNVPNPSEPYGNIPKDSENFGNVPNDAEGFRTVPKSSEAFRTVPKDSESFRTVPHSAERKSNHSVTVREAARMFEEAGVARTERSIVNWCRPNKDGVARLDSYYDPNDRRYYITPESVQAAIIEEKAKAVRPGDVSATEEAVPKRGETKSEEPAPRRSAPDTEELRAQIRDLEISNRVKDKYIEKLEKDADSFRVEREGYIKTLMSFSERIGEFTARLLLPSSGQTQNHDRSSGEIAAKETSRIE